MILMKIRLRELATLRQWEERHCLQQHLDMHMSHPGSCYWHLLIHQLWGGGGESTFPISSQMIRLLSVAKA